MLAIMRYNITGYSQPHGTIRKETRNGIDGTKIKDKGSIIGRLPRWGRVRKSWEKR
jgi:hypothetical protein